uniref:Nondiscriminating glutamyl-tRNA synthetase EARS2, mitochondrial n=1 Tax=Angiostrongylus cantonensis TaxID=6313 RepID=A0A0K0DBX5_ANGCA
MVHLFSKRLLHSIDQVRVRFAPSPTGQLHLGSLRTALYNFLFARHHKGQFALRIEDTDKARLVPGSEENIERILSHYGLHYDEGPSKLGPHGPYRQSERLTFYKDAVDRLIDSGLAYRCFCSEDRLSLLRKDAVRRNQIPKYDMKCRSIDSVDSQKRAASGEPFVVRLKLDKQNVSFTDDTYGVIEQYIDESDMVLLKSDGFPTYHLANVVDDRSMRISHVIRGMEWLSSTGKHVILYKAFGWSHPRWLHLPLITKDGKKKLSKRDKDGFVDFYEQYLGALPNAVLNLLIRNGSGIRDFDATHLYTLDEMIANFDEERIGKRNLQLDEECLVRYGRMAFRMADVDNQILPAIKMLIKCDLPSVEIPDDEYLRKVVAFLKTNEENFAFLSSLTRGDFRWFLSKPVTADRLLFIFDGQIAMDALRHLQECDSLDIDLLKKVAEQLGWPYAKFLTLIRVSLIDTSKGPPIKELVSFFGITECRKRFHDMVGYIQSQTSYVSPLKNETL